MHKEDRHHDRRFFQLFMLIQKGTTELFDKWGGGTEVTSGEEVAQVTEKASDSFT